MDYHKPKLVGDSNCNHFSSCGNFRGTNQHNRWHLVRKFSIRQILYSSDSLLTGHLGGVISDCSVDCKGRDHLHMPQSITQTRCTDESLLTGPGKQHPES